MGFSFLIWPDLAGSFRRAAIVVSRRCFITFQIQRRLRYAQAFGFDNYNILQLTKKREQCRLEWQLQLPNLPYAT